MRASSAKHQASAAEASMTSTDQYFRPLSSSSFHDDPPESRFFRVSLKRFRRSMPSLSAVESICTSLAMGLPRRVMTI